MRYRIGRRTSSAVPVVDIPLTPLIDTALTLLVIFMITSPMLQNNIQVELPESNMRDSSVAPDAQHTVVITKTGDFEYQSKKYTWNNRDALLGHIQKAIGTQKSQTVYVYADGAVVWKSVAELINYLNTVGGIRYVALATEKSTT